MPRYSQDSRLPDDETLDRLYEPKERDSLIEVMQTAQGIKSPKTREEFGRKSLRTIWPDDLQYISKTHWIRTKRPGEVILFKPNYAQEKLYKAVQERREANEPVRVICLKARQLGYSTWIQSFLYNLFDRNPHHFNLVISFDELSTQELFQKSIFVHKNLWFPRSLARDSKGVIEAEISHGSTSFVRTAGNVSAGRSQTFHALHCSEIPMWQDSGETLLAALQAIPTLPGTYVFFESTAKGAMGDFYDYWKAAERGENSYLPFFAPWFWDVDYTMAFPSADHKRQFGRSLSVKDVEYKRLYNLTLEQMNWRQWCIRDRCQGSLRRWRQEYPACADEAFLSTGSPVFDADKVAELAENATKPRWQGDIMLVKS